MTSATGLRGEGRLRDVGWRLLAGASAGMLAVQVVHVVEHVLQTGYWLAHPMAAPWLTPWAAAGRDTLAAAVDGRSGSGNEVLHLGGNLVFLVGLVAFAVVLQHHRVMAPRALGAALWLQGAHVLEHVVLTASWFATGQARGVTTLFGAVHGATAGALRVWTHLALNLAATGMTLAALNRLRQSEREWWR